MTVIFHMYVHTYMNLSQEQFESLQGILFQRPVLKTIFYFIELAKSDLSWAFQRRIF
jgi:hypothetical protein